MPIVVIDPHFAPPPAAPSPVVVASWWPLVSSQIADCTGRERWEARIEVADALSAGGKVAVWYASSDPWTVVGFALRAADGEVVWAWTRPANRGHKGKPGSGGVMTALLQAIGVDLDQPIRARYRSPAGEGIARRGRLKIVWRDAAPERKEPHERADRRADPDGP